MITNLQSTDSNDEQDNTHQIDRLLDAIELVKDDKRSEALPILRSLIHDNSDFEDAWLWMSVAIDSLDQAIICLDNVLRINPENRHAALALYRLQMKEFASQRKRSQLRSYRDLSLVLLWLLIFTLLFAILFSSSLSIVTHPM
ncbi:MAG: hypothetical protein Q9P01_15500 [Anaerolineae bacterium]|nr:hypothetical protein [Anaerolineae bacterium]MDQ7036181.1 hypothetical protein [Anaerolineae bacterium]